MSAAHRFNNALRYRTEDHPNQTQLTPRYVLHLGHLPRNVRRGLGDKAGYEAMVARRRRRAS